MIDYKKVGYESKASQDGWEMWQMLELVKTIEPKVIVEIGCDGGGSLWTWQEAFSPELLVGIDTNTTQMSLQEALKNGLEVTMLWEDSQNEGTKQHLIDLLNGRLIDFLFIDGDHKYESVKRDFELYSPLVRKGGMVGFHDTNNRGIEGVQVDRFMAELDKNFSYATADFQTDNMSPGTRVITV